MATRHAHRGRKSFRPTSKSIHRILKSIAGPAVFIEQITSKDTSAINSQTTTLNKVKTIANVVTGRVAGINFFQDVTKFPQTMNPAGLLNKWTYLGAGLIAYGEIAKRTKFLPKGALVGSYGKVILPAGAVGGFFDAPSNTQLTSQASTNPSAASQYVQTSSL